MRIGLDLDGVVYDFHASVLHHLVTNRDYDATKAKVYDNWEFYKDWGLTLQEFLDECNAGVDAGIIFAHGEAFPGSRESVQRIIDAGHSIHIITDRSFGQPGASETATAVWIARELPKAQSLTFSPDKTIVCTDMMIDDKLSNYDALIEAGCDAYLLDRPWNIVPGDTRKRVSTLDEFADRVLERTLVLT